jgi:xeroderma pigmentosum group C-complementing protein
MLEGSQPRPPGNDAVPVIYQEMLADAVSSSPLRFNEEDKAFKRRRVAGRVISEPNGDISGQETEHFTAVAGDTDTDNATSERAPKRQQTTFVDSDSSMDGDMDWEEVDLAKDRVERDFEDEEKPLDLVIGGKDSSAAMSRTPRRKGDALVEKKMRLEVHKTHLLCLLAHVHLRNHWCEDVQVQVG